MVSLFWNTPPDDNPIQFQARIATTALQFNHKLYTVGPFWKGQESLTKVAKFGPFPCTILYKTCLFYPSWQATSFERPPSWVAFIEGFHCISHFICLPRTVSNLTECWAPSQYKDGTSWYGDSHVKDKTVTGPPYLYQGIPILVRPHLYIETPTIRCF